MEESLAFFTALEDWVAQVPQLYLVPSNLADYSLYPWAKALKGALGLSPRTEIDPAFRTDLAKALGNQAILGPRGSALSALAQKTYGAVKVSVEARVRAKNESPEELRAAVSKALQGGIKVFNKQGFYDLGEYSVFRYGSSGTFNQSAVFRPN
jgi:hypothetical protein